QAAELPLFIVATVQRCSSESSRIHEKVLGKFVGRVGRRSDLDHKSVGSAVLLNLAAVPEHVRPHVGEHHSSCANGEQVGLQTCIVEVEFDLTIKRQSFRDQKVSAATRLTQGISPFGVTCVSKYFAVAFEAKGERRRAAGVVDQIGRNLHSIN